MGSVDNCPHVSLYSVLQSNTEKWDPALAGVMVPT